MGVLKKSLQTWHRSADSRGASAARGVGSQSVLSGTEAEVESKDSILFEVQRRNESENSRSRNTAAGSNNLSVHRRVLKVAG